MKNIKRLILLTTIISQLVFCIQINQKFKLTIYEAYQCSYCKFVSSQLKTIIQEYHLQPRLSMSVVDCEINPNLCRDSKNKPLIVMQNDNNQKLGEIGGVHSKLYFRDWICGFVRKNPIVVEKVKENGEKYEKIVIKNPEQVRQFFKFQVESQNKMQEQKLDILKQVTRTTHPFFQSSTQSQPTNIFTSKHSSQTFVFWDSLKQHNFQASGVGLIVMMIVVLMFIIYIRLTKNDGYKKVNGRNTNDED